MSRLIVVVGALIALNAAGAGAAVHRFDLKAGPIRRTLIEWSRQSGEQVLFDYTAVRGMTKPVHGEYEDATALMLMLGDLPYTGDPVNTVTWAVGRIPTCRPWDVDPPAPPCRQPSMLVKL